jgi:hypothetical protein
MLRAWSVRCQTLEEEVERLARLVTKLEKEKEVAKEQVQVSVATKVRFPPTPVDSKVKLTLP